MELFFSQVVKEMTKYLKQVKFGFIYHILKISAISNLEFLVKEILAVFENVIEKKAD